MIFIKSDCYQFTLMIPEQSSFRNMFSKSVVYYLSWKSSSSFHCLFKIQVNNIGLRSY